MPSHAVPAGRFGAGPFIHRAAPIGSFNFNPESSATRNAACAAGPAAGSGLNDFASRCGAGSMAGAS